MVLCALVCHTSIGVTFHPGIRGSTYRFVRNNNDCCSLKLHWLPSFRTALIRDYVFADSMIHLIRIIKTSCDAFGAATCRKGDGCGPFALRTYVFGFQKHGYRTCEMTFFSMSIVSCRQSARTTVPVCRKQSLRRSRDLDRVGFVFAAPHKAGPYHRNAIASTPGDHHHH